MRATPLKPFQEFFKTESASGVVLLAVTALALAWANSPFAGSYALLHTLHAGGHLGGVDLPHSPAHWINDGLMAVFFLLVGLEIKREMLVGELARPAQAALPGAAALGGMLFPAAIYAAFNHGGPAAAGWGIPMATDIAFALGILSLLGKRVPASLKAFLAALAILDDLGAVVVIALFYGGALNSAALGIAAGLFVALLLLGRMGVRALWAYLIPGAVLWLAVLASGVHATVAGVLLAMTIPAGPAKAGEDADASPSPLARLEHALHPWVAWGILPLFALVNAGVTLDASLLAGLAAPLSLGVELGLLLGKPAGILLFAYLAVRLRLGEKPAGVSWKALAGCACLGGIGFTMSLFIAGRSFPDAQDFVAAKAAIFLASAVSAIAGCLLLSRPGQSTTENT
jgi:NhaA family Na+:H+ antiporter